MTYKIKLGLLLAVVLSLFMMSTAIWAKSGDVGTQVPTILTQPQSAALYPGEEYRLFVDAAVDGGWKLTYQWYYGLTEEKDTATTWPILTSAENFLMVSDAGTPLYYYVVVSHVVGDKVVGSVESKTALITGRVSATAPLITANPQNISVNKGERAILSVSATSSDGGTLSYQWFRNADLDSVGWRVVAGATKADYAPNTDKVGTSYYRVVVTNTNSDIDGKQTETLTSYAAAVSVTDAGIVDAAFPVVNGPHTIVWELEKGYKPTVLSVQAVSPDGGTLSYQWYKTSNSSNIGGVAIDGAVNAEFDPGDKKRTALAVYYYVEVTNKNAAVNGKKTAVTTSLPATVLTGELKPVPNKIPSTGGTDIAKTTSVNRAKGVFTAGPNPVGLSGDVMFFWQGRLLKNGSLSIYDASGNVVKKISINDNALNSQAKRKVGSWDLTDKKGRQVPEGTYLVKGKVATSGSKAEKVSVILSVR